MFDIAWETLHAAAALYSEQIPPSATADCSHFWFAALLHCYANGGGQRVRSIAHFCTALGLSTVYFTHAYGFYIRNAPFGEDMRRKGCLTGARFYTVNKKLLTNYRTTIEAANNEAMRYD
jgi:hypothetical protein